MYGKRKQRHRYGFSDKKVNYGFIRLRSKVNVNNGMGTSIVKITVHVNDGMGTSIVKCIMKVNDEMVYNVMIDFMTNFRSRHIPLNLPHEITANTYRLSSVTRLHIKDAHKACILKAQKKHIA